MRSEFEIQRAHDLLRKIILGHARSPFEDDPAADELLRECANVLCWILQHDHNTVFASNLEKIEKCMRSNPKEIRLGSTD